MIIYYNKDGIGDVLIVYLKDGAVSGFERRGNVVRIADMETGEATGFNFFNASQILPPGQTAGRVDQKDTLIEILNRKIADEGFLDRLKADRRPDIVTGYVEAIKKHPDSDHMHICQVDTGDEKLQIVCGAPNIDLGQKVVVARVGALMPNGMIIRPTVLRGVSSDGMICSARELALPGAPQKRGILVLDRATEVGKSFYALVYDGDVQVGSMPK